MAEFDLKAYTTRAVELETAIYTQKKLMDDHQNLMLSRRPAAPKKPQLRPPVKPTMPIIVEESNGGNVIALIAVGFVFLFSIWMISALPWFGIFCLISCIIAAGSLLSGFSKESNTARTAEQEYERDLEKYNRELEEYNRKHKRAKEHYHASLERYTAQVEAYDAKTEAMMERHACTLASLEAALQEFYGQNVIFPKYRNMVAIVTINEYLMSGRCFELEGPNGAYNLYEMELRQNIVISQLSNIISNLEQIRDNQFTLYQELVNANTIISDILHEIRVVGNNTKLTAYFAGITALIEAAPKVYIGSTF